MRFPASTRRLFGAPLALLIILGALVLPASAMGASFTNSTLITITPNGAATPYPSTITPTGLTDAVTKVTVTLHGFEHTFISDVDVLLVAPNGAAVVLMSDMCAFFQTTAPNTYTFDDAGLEPAPPTLCFVTLNPLKPFNNLGDLPLLCAEDPDFFPGPAPPGPSAGGYPTGPQFLSTFNGMSAAVAMGTWSLYVVDDCLDSGRINEGWTLDITTGPTAVTVNSFSARRLASGVDLRWSTGAESGIAGFNVFRAGPTGTTKVNRTLVPTKGGVFGSSYRLVDRNARAGTKYTYRLQVLNRDGSRSWSGSTLVRTAR